MNAISGTRRGMKEMADGTIRLSVDIDPGCRAAFFANFPNIDMPIAIAPLVADFESRQDRVSEASVKGGPLAKLAGMWCNESGFQKWLAMNFGEAISNASNAAEFIRTYCGIWSRAELDSNPEAAKRFNDSIRMPFSDWLRDHA